VASAADDDAKARAWALAGLHTLFVTSLVPIPGRRDALKKHLTAAGIGTEIYDPLPLHQHKCFAHLPPVSLPVSEQLASEVLSVPVFPELLAAERAAVVEAISSFTTG
jgi:dTDP-4-amino-4,6-dideoxygalactose transaminase